MTPQITVRAELQMALGECPRWHDAEQAWYWVDILGNKLYRLEPNAENPEQQLLDFLPACFAFTDKGQLVLSGSAGIFLLTHFGATPQCLLNPEAHLDGHRFNDGTVLPNGDFILGSIGDGETATGIRYRFSLADGSASCTAIEQNYAIINGQCCSPDERYCYVTDTPEQVIYRQEILSDGQLGPREVFYRCDADEYPDGAATDSAGNYWVAMYGSGKIAVISPRGEKLRDIALPAQQPTMVAFGGIDGRQLLVTTANQNLSEVDKGNRAEGAVLLLDVDQVGARVNLVTTG